MTEEPRIVVVGGVAGGMSTATRLRRLLEHASITVLERSGNVSYANCGLPYHVGGVIEEREDLLLQTPESLAARFAIDVRVHHDVIEIDRENSTLTVRNLQDGTTRTLEWDTLVLSPGARPATPPIPGIERARSLRTVEDTDALIAASTDITSVVVMGGGFIGLELAENFRHRGLDVSVVEALPQVMRPLDIEMAHHVHEHLRENGVNLVLGTSVEAIHADSVTLSDGTAVPADLVISAVGVRPETDLAERAGLRISKLGAIAVDEQQRTSDPRIFAVGDATEKRDADGNPALIPLAGPANRDGRQVADIIAGRNVTTARALGTSILGIFGLQVASTGRNEQNLRALGRTVRVIHTHPLNHAGYYPGASTLRLKLIIDADTDEILGAQAIGTEGADKRIDVIATAMRAGLSASDLSTLDLAYAPQFGSAKDPAAMLGHIASNLRTGDMTTIQWHELAQAMDAGAQLVDIRTAEEHAEESIPGAVNIELDSLRERLDEIEGTPIVFCAVGLRGHLAGRILAGHGIASRNLDGGITTWKAGTFASQPALVNA